MKIKKIMIIGLSILLLQSVVFAKSSKVKLPDRVRIGVPLIKQNDNYSCATTSLAMVMSYYKNEPFDKDFVWEKSKSRIKNITKIGNDMRGLKRAAKAFGFKHYRFKDRMSIKELKSLLVKKIPIVVNIRNFYSKFFHAVVLTGYDDVGFFVSDPADGEYRVDYKTFKSHWYAYLYTPKRKRYYRSAFILRP